MKFTVIALLFPSVFAFADLPVESVKAMDDIAVLCVAPGDAGRMAYRPEGMALRRAGEHVKFTFTLRALKCIFEPGEGMKFIPRSLNESYAGIDRDGRPVTFDITRSEAILMSSDITRVSSVVLTDLPAQKVEFFFALEKVFTNDQRRRFEGGMPVVLNLEYYNLVSTSVNLNGEAIALGQRPWGSYFFEFTFQK